jgi:hypothetical protein
MKVKDLIEFLKDVENKDRPVYLYHMNDILLLSKTMFDLSIDDVVDINLPSDFFCDEY